MKIFIKKIWNLGKVIISLHPQMRKNYFTQMLFMVAIVQW